MSGAAISVMHPHLMLAASVTTRASPRQPPDVVDDAPHTDARRRAILDVADGRVAFRSLMCEPRRYPGFRATATVEGGAQVLRCDAARTFRSTPRDDVDVDLPRERAGAGCRDAVVERIPSAIRSAS
jgi:hypothetical protein